MTEPLVTPVEASVIAAVVEAATMDGRLPPGGVYGNIPLPDAGEGGCCMGSAAMGAQWCTCWETVYDLDQKPVRPGEAVARKTPCHDCAYRAGSPERSGDERYTGDEDFLARIVRTGEKFWCHQGLRRAVKLRHPSGAEVVIETDHYDPPKNGAVPHKADGTPGDLCAGWAARRAKYLSQETGRG
jgi:hypothetical protein